ncbi:MAG: hypothetical protein VYA34_05730 [Myxococcota bacterium]|nr:hypothetical protein [Myxococcota bacterium]
MLVGIILARLNRLFVFMGAFFLITSGVAFGADGEEKADEAPDGIATDNSEASTGTDSIPENSEEDEKSFMEVFKESAGFVEPSIKGRKFIKGHLIHPGTRQILSRYDHFGFRLGAEVLDADVYATLDPGLAVYSKTLSFSFHVPLRLLAVDARRLGAGEVEYGGLKIRRQDWDEVSDYGKIIRFVTMGRKEDRFYLSLNSLRPASIGHSLVMDKYQSNMDIDRTMTGLLFDAYNDYAGFQFQMNDVTFSNRILGALAFIKPLSFVSDNVNEKSLSVGIEYLSDLKAPLCVQKSLSDDTCVRGGGHQADLNDSSLNQTFVRSHEKSGLPVVRTGVVHSLGTSIEYKFLKDKTTDYKLYGTVHKFMNEGGGVGSSLGVLGRLNFGEEYIHALRVRAEYIGYGDGFLPDYFDSFYEVNKYSFVPRRYMYQAVPTKAQAVFGDEENGFTRSADGFRHGFNLEFSWGLFRGVRTNKKISAGFGLQDSTGNDDSSFYVHLEVPYLEILQFSVTYMRNNANSMGDLFTGDSMDEENAFVLGGIRLQVLPILFLNLHYARVFRKTQGPGTEYHLGTENIPGADKTWQRLYPSSTLYENVHTVNFDIELGWEFPNYDDDDVDQDFPDPDDTRDLDDQDVVAESTEGTESALGVAEDEAAPQTDHNTEGGAL